MSVDDRIRLEILNDHYKDTCERLRDRTNVRERLLLGVLLILGFQYFQILEPVESSKAVVSFFKGQEGIQVLANVHALNCIVWFILVATVMRYFQTNIFIERQYKYLHKTEERLAKFMGIGIVDREGKDYLDSYPIFSDWAHVLYTWIVPVFIALSGTYKIYVDFIGSGQLLGALGISLLLYVALVASVILYLRFIHWGK